MQRVAFADVVDEEERRSRRRAAIAHLGGIVMPWWVPFLARQSNRGNQFLEDHRRLAQRLQGCVILVVMVVAVISIALPPARFVNLLVWLVFVTTEIRLGVLASRGHPYRRSGVLAFERVP